MRRQDRHHLCRQDKGSGGRRDDRFGQGQGQGNAALLCPAEPGKQHTEQRRLDGNRIKSDQYHAADRLSQD
ncbi:MAG: hypothetical protein E5Y61_22975 [Mesorhizobium sp.]|nr:MAG: hypothetical protein E5Y61_22975 [Mesorhizobium sp.]TIM66563.1 MAG: hypothetical protein E5Y60_19510 [Mesorhizobium sp.]